MNCYFQRCGKSSVSSVQLCKEHMAHYTGLHHGAARAGIRDQLAITMLRAQSHTGSGLLPNSLDAWSKFWANVDNCMAAREQSDADDA